MSNTATPYLGLALTPEDTEETFKSWRTKINGEQNSNMTKIDGAFVNIDADVSDMKNEHLAPPTTITIGCIDSAHQRFVNYHCDGSNDTTMFQNAINSLPPDGGKIVVLEGEYNITSKLTCNKNVVFEGMGNGTVLNFNAGSYIRQDDIQISLLKLQINFVSGKNADVGYSFINGNIVNVVSKRRKVSMSDCTLTFTNNNFVKCASVFHGCGYVKIINSSIELINNAVPTNSSYTPRINLVYDESQSGYAGHCAEISNCDILCQGKISDNYKAWACISKCSGVVISNCNITLENGGSISEGIDVIDALYLISMSNCKIRHTGTTNVYIGLKIFNGNFYSSNGGITYFANGAIITNNYFGNHTENDIKVGLSGNSVATIIGNRADFTCTFTSSTATGTVKANNI